MDIERNIQEAVNYIRSKTGKRPRIGLILGSGLGGYGDTISDAVYIPYGEIPHFPISTVEGHKGRFVLNDTVICMQGRFHYYEGYSMEEVTFPIRVMKLLGVESIIITNAAGGVNEAFAGGTLMLITDHINFMGSNPLIGRNMDSFGTRFPDMSYAYNKDYQRLAIETAEELGIPLEQGVYIGFTGPSFETPAEIRMARIIGGDAVGMSTVPEVIAANHSGIRVLGISCITNPAAGVVDKPLNHEEVQEAANKVQKDFTRLIQRLVDKLSAGL